ncbi:hypothetical protein PLICRDRAFT_219756 [Plicaturopsis crispa FD-325 SS-3]|nr:hypothetical protein PLICRDRAFT_219756 [Plicaturopsis crispa FD-325 SS-3]
MSTKKTTLACVPPLPTGIGHLPTELLSIIFHLVYLSSREILGYRGVIRKLEDVAEWPDDDLDLPSLFPYGISSVCRLWQDIMADTPVYWTRLVVYVGIGEAPARNVESQLRWSADLPFAITVMRREYDEDGSQDIEKAQMTEIMALLKPHIPRILTIDFDILYTASLPMLCRDFEGMATHLTFLRLESKISANHDGRDLDVDMGADTELVFHCPELRSLHINGNNLQGAIKQKWHGSFDHVQYVGMSRSDSPLPLGDTLIALQAFSELGTLEISGVAFTRDTPSLPDTVTFPCLSKIIFDHLDGEAVQDILHAIEEDYIETICIVGCPLLIRDPDVVPGVFNLDLEEIGSEEDPISFLQLWTARDVSMGARTLGFTNSPCLTDAVLMSMSRGGMKDDYWVCPAIRELKIYGCRNFSGRCLRRMVEARKIASVKYIDDPDSVDANVDNKISFIESLVVKGCGPVLDKEDLDWLKAHVDTFVYRVR